MIASIWHGVTATAKADEYVDYLNEIGDSDYQATEGNKGVCVLGRIEDERAHFLTASFWESIEAVERFAGADPEKARYYPEDEVFLLEFEPTVEHYEVLTSPTTRTSHVSDPSVCSELTRYISL